VLWVRGKMHNISGAVVSTEVAVCSIYTCQRHALSLTVCCWQDVLLLVAVTAGRV